ncbi:excalibur calcium-binding domain-containing protein [Qipengyuania sp.]|uniref:excalibur calcium-binding domain-containing protein n=1 Tax=Qipengyuania sp. TaxID=2004515 RepID=UPI003AF8855E
MKAFAPLLPLALLASPPLPALAHPGGLNAEGCHNNRKTGEYHCHRNRRPTQQAPTVQLRGGVYFANCDAARAAGAAPIYRGQPGYRPALDRDNDGVACEPWRGR